MVRLSLTRPSNEGGEVLSCEHDLEISMCDVCGYEERVCRLCSKAESMILADACIAAREADLARMKPVVDAAVAYTTAWEEVRDGDAGKLLDTIRAAVKAMKEGKP